MVLNTFIIFVLPPFLSAKFSALIFMLYFGKQPSVKTLQAGSQFLNIWLLFLKDSSCPNIVRIVHRKS